MGRSSESQTVRGKAPTVEWKKTAINALKSSEKRQSFKVEGHTGLRVEVMPYRIDKETGDRIEGRRVFRYVTRFGDGPLYVTLRDSAGQVLHWGKDGSVYDLASVEEVLGNIKRLIRSGINPNEQAQLAKEAATLADLFKSYCSHFEQQIKAGERRPKSLSQAEGLWRNHIEAKLGNKKAAEITEAQAAKFMTDLLAATAYGTHNKVLRLLKSMFNHGINRARLLDRSPFAGISLMTEPKRERRLTLDELHRLRDALAEEKPLYQDVVQMLLLTGQRKGIVYAMEWAEIDRQRGTWTISASKMKAKRQHVVPLGAAAMAILERRSAEARPGEKYVFPAPSIRSKTGHVVEKTGEGSFWRRITRKAGLYDPDNSDNNLRVHDLRRSVASWAVENGASIQSVSKLLGHSNIALTASVYSHLSTDAVRSEMAGTELLLTGGNNAKSKLERLRDEILGLSEDERQQLMEMIEEVQG
ncbi:MAG: tyrosine-type recombinase/integrase [Porticoccaceae bacterium]